MTNSPVLSVRDVGKRFMPSSLWGLRGSRSGAGTLALSGVSFEVHAGEMIGLLGPNGAGKTTLLKTIATLLYPTSGQVLLDGVDVYSQPERVHGRMGLVTCDERSFYWRLSGRQNLEFFSAIYRMETAAARVRIGQLLRMLDLDAAADRPYRGYSSGMKQKLAIARGLLTNPRMVLFDEPTRSLDPLSASRIREWIGANRRRNPSQANVLATNLLSEAELLCDRVIILHRGRIVAAGTVSEIRERIEGEYDVHRVTYAGGPANFSLPPDAGLIGLDIEVDNAGVGVARLRARRDSACLSSLLTAILGEGGCVLRCETATLSFDEVFRGLIESHRETAPQFEMASADP
jgi:ABC-2 type transport system ATP-binding protein